MTETQRWVFLGAAFCLEADAVVPIRHRSFLHGETLFETVKAEAGRPIWMAEHLARLREAAAVLDFRWAPEPNLAEVLLELLARNTLTNAKIRITVTRDGNPGWIITADPLELPPDAAAYRDGVTVSTWSPRWAPWGGSGVVAKSGAWMSQTQARRRARESGHWEALRLAPGSQVCEGTSSNVFWLRDRVLETPALELGILPGITRGKLLAAARFLGIETRELRDPTLGRLEEASELFLTNSLWDVLPVTSCDGQTIGTGRVGSGAGRLRQALRAWPGGPLSPESRP